MKGAALMTGCVFAYVISDAFMKFLFSEIALFQAVFLRSIITVLPVLLPTSRTGAAYQCLRR